MEILERNSPKEPSCDVTCPECASKLRVAPSDGKWVSDQREGDYYIIPCPVCEKRFPVAESKFRR